MLCLSGDHQDFGDHPDAMGVFDIDSMQLIHMVKTMREEAKFANGEEIDEPPRMFIGAACNPFADPFEFQVRRLAKKIKAGADFIQTQCIYNMKRFREILFREHPTWDCLRKRICSPCDSAEECRDGRIHAEERPGNGYSR